MTNACPKCSAALTGGRHSEDDAPSMFAFACGTVKFATGDMVRGAACLEKQLAKRDAAYQQARKAMKKRTRHYGNGVTGHIELMDPEASVVEAYFNDALLAELEKGEK